MLRQLINNLQNSFATLSSRERLDWSVKRTFRKDSERTKPGCTRLTCMFQGLTS